MKLLASMAFVILYISSLHPKPAFAVPKNSLPRDIPDVFKLYEIFDFVVAIFDQDEDGDLDCLTNVRTQLDMEAKTATYVWMLKGNNGQEGKNATMHMWDGPTPDVSLFTWDDEPTVNEAHFIYTDYKDCVVVQVPYHGQEQCILWTSREAKTNIPQHCIDQYEDICPPQTWEFDQETCGDE